jgi:hypothetical protein
MERGKTSGVRQGNNDSAKVTMIMSVLGLPNCGTAPEGSEIAESEL